MHTLAWLDRYDIGLLGPGGRALTLAGVVLAGFAPEPAVAQQDIAGPVGREIAGVPALNYDADEGFGYGVILELYEYGRASRTPYEYTIQPVVFLTTEGRRDLTLFFDSPHLLPAGLRIDGYLGSEKQVASPYYGLGNEAVFSEAVEAADPYYYRFGRTRNQLRVNVQRGLGRYGLRALLGVGVSHVGIDPVPFDSGTSLVAQTQSAAPEGWWNSVRVGLIRDTRDRELGPRAGSWTELLVQRADQRLGSEESYTRLTLADRRYRSLLPGLVFANRIVVQQVTGDAPFYELFTVESSFKQQEGLGGAKTLRGVAKNRFVGRGSLLWNAELRWRVADWELGGRRFHAVVSGFIDSGRVWSDESPPWDELTTDLHHGYGGGLRVGMGESFIVAVDLGTSTEGGVSPYIGLGYLY